MLFFHGIANPVRRVAIAIRTAAITNGAWFWKQFTTLWYNKNWLENNGVINEETLAGRQPRTALAWRWSNGHATHVLRIGAGQLRRGMESEPPGTRARHPAPLRGGGLGMHHHQHLWRIADHAQSSPSDRQCGRNQQGRREDRAPGLRGPGGLRAWRHRALRRIVAALRRVH